MTPFSTILSAQIKAKNIKTYPLAQYCGIDRSNMYKLINGKRNPASEEIVHKIANYMRLSPAECRELIEAYRITVIGHETYYRRKNVEEFMACFSGKHKFEECTDISTHSISTHQKVEDSIPLVGKAKLYHAIYGVFSSEAKNEHGHLKLLFQPDSDEFMDILIGISKNKPHLKIEHIICLNNNENITSEKRNYNLACLQKIIPMYRTSLCDYMPLCYYDNMDSRNSTFNLLSSMIVTTKFVIIFSTLLQYGILFTNKNALYKFQGIFDDLKSETIPIIHKIDPVFSQLTYFNNLQPGIRTGFSFQQEPCLIPLMPLSFPEKYIVQHLPNRENFLISVKQYIKERNELLKLRSTQFIFTETGIFQFLNTGRLSELPKKLYKPVEYRDRILIIRNLINACLNKQYRMLRPESPLINSTLYIYVTSSNGYLLFSSLDGNPVYLNLTETSLLFAFYDYLNSLNDKWFYTTEETVAILRGHLNPHNTTTVME